MASGPTLKKLVCAHDCDIAPNASQKLEFSQLPFVLAVQVIKVNFSGVSMVETLEFDELSQEWDCLFCDETEGEKQIKIEEKTSIFNYREITEYVVTITRNGQVVHSQEHLPYIGYSKVENTDIQGNSG